MVSITENNYDEFIKNFSDDSKSSLTHNFFNTDLKTVTNAVGDFQGDIEFLKAQSKQGYIQAAYKASFSNEPDGVIVTVTFKEDDSTNKLQGIFFNSPQIIEASKNKYSRISNYELNVVLNSKFVLK